MIRKSKLSAYTRISNTLVECGVKRITIEPAMLNSTEPIQAGLKKRS